MCYYQKQERGREHGSDVDMFHQVTYSIAMGNAADYVKVHASEVTERNDEEGLVKALKRHQIL